MKKYAAILVLVIFICVSITGCGETIKGVGKDVDRVKNGVQTIFFRKSQ